MVNRFKSGQFSGLITVTVGEDVTKGAINFFDSEFCLRQIVEKPSPAQVNDFKAQGLLKTGDPVWYNAGIYMFTPALFEFTAQLQKSPRGEYELPDAITALIRAGHKIAGCKTEGRWVDVRDPETLRGLDGQS
jgi:dTDP-glucose pyrophosphorylase